MSDLIQIDSQTVAVRLHFGVYIVVPTWNLDVGLGLIRDRIIERWTSRAVEAVLKPGDTYINVGANLGYYAFLGAYRVGRGGQSHAIEANRNLFPYLMRSLFWSGYPDVVRLYNCAASDEDDLRLDMMFDPQFIGGASVALRVPAPESLPVDWRKGLWENVDLAAHFDADGRTTPTIGHFVSVSCLTRRLDTLFNALEKVDLLHMDIEGSEPLAVLGGLNLMKRSPRASVIMEWSPNYVLAPGMLTKTNLMCDFFEQSDYKYYRIRYEDFEATLPAPRLDRLATREALFSAPHCDILVTKSLGAHHRDWPSLVI